ncbi:MAG TPA: toprim domain-containing protein, partial [Dehalococcoidia bacterium]|nr:toprim domain-containing protein [Dehalococcoidia bacterium]
KENISFIESLKYFSKKLGISDKSFNSSRSKILEEIRKINNLAVNFFKHSLFSDKGALTRDYLKERGITKESALKFNLGYNPKGNELYNYLISSGIESKNIIDFGLASENSKGDVIDFFSERLIFPISELKDNVLGFGGRIMSDKNPKYINTKKNLLFDKGSVLYGLDQAAENIRDEDECVLVEGYTDVITAHQFGFKNVIASMGTAITIYQANKISDISNSVVIALDSDQAGSEATLNALDKSWGVFKSNNKELPAGITNKSIKKNFNLRIVTLPDNSDPDDFIRNSSEKWKKSILNASPIVEYLIESLSNKFDLSTAEGKELIEEIIRPFISKEKNPYIQDQYVSMLSKELNVSEERIKAGFDSKTKRFNDNSNRLFKLKENSFNSFQTIPDDKNRLKILSEYLTGIVLSNKNLNKDLFIDWDIEMIDDTICKQILYKWSKEDNSIENENKIEENLYNEINYFQSDKLIFFDNEKLINVISQCKNDIEREYLIAKNVILMLDYQKNIDEINKIENRIKILDNTTIKKIY